MAPNPNNEILVGQLLSLLEGGNAHVELEAATADFPEDRRGLVPAGLPYSAWQLLEHLRISQRDIVDFSSPPADGYHALRWPADYWPAFPAPPAPQSWDQTLSLIRNDRKAFLALLTSPGADLLKPFSWGEGQNLLREALLLADHNSYHLGELVLLRRLLGIWKA